MFFWGEGRFFNPRAETRRRRGGYWGGFLGEGYILPQRAQGTQRLFFWREGRVFNPRAEMQRRRGGYWGMFLGEGYNPPAEGAGNVEVVLLGRREIF